jgi:plastocyanin
MRFRGTSIRTLFAAIVLLAGLAYAVACGSSYSSPTTTPTPGTGGTGAAADVTITIMGMNGANSFSPNPAAVKAGQTVSWHNADAIAHTATGTGFDTGAIAGGATSAPITFSTAGTINYHCSFHPSMVGTLNVQ